MKILISGGAGYIGSTTLSAFSDKGYSPVVLDSLVTGRQEFVKSGIFYPGDVADTSIIESIFKEHPDISCAIHFAASILVPESVEKPWEYYNNNVVKSLSFFKNLVDFGCERIVFSSSASIYDVVNDFKVTEDAPLKPVSPYARTKLMIEMILEDLCKAGDTKGISLRYFNPIGADPLLRSGPYDPKPSHVLGKMIATATGKEPVFRITGNNWPTRDGSGIRDYIHVWDLAQAHVSAVENFDSAIKDSSGYLPINLGTGCGVTVKEMVLAFEEVYGSTLSKQEAEPRPGDTAGAFADITRAKLLLGWTPVFSTAQAISHAFEWDKKRPEILGY